ncbi:hypothetical protein Tco_1239853 [Tanacetum coccineum]
MVSQPPNNTTSRQWMLEHGLYFLWQQRHFPYGYAPTIPFRMSSRAGRVDRYGGLVPSMAQVGQVSMHRSNPLVWERDDLGKLLQRKVEVLAHDPKG